MLKINARDCKLKEVSNTKELSLFLEENHSQGNAKSIIAYALFFKNKLVQVMTFGKPRFNKNFQWELIRDCTKKGYIINGGVSKLWKCFIENNNVRSCVCYSYPHDEDNLYTNKYVDYCGFVNISKAKPAKKIYYEGIWNGENKRIDKSILERHGVDRLLGGKFGNDRTNEQILLDLEFKKKCEDGYNPQVDSYFPYGIVYKITDLDTGKFYIGETTVPGQFEEEKYNGSGNEDWREYYKEFENKHNFKREILKSDFKTPKDLYDYEVKEIRKYCIKLDNGNYKVDESTGCMNRKTTSQPEMPICPECGAAMFLHKKHCSMYNRKPCSECGSISVHLKTCSKYNEPKPCSECGGKWGHHTSNCSQFKLQEPCHECGSLTTHKDWCSHAKKCTCSECGGKLGRHYKTCSKYHPQSFCEECGGVNGHKKSCSQYTASKPCPECGTIKGHTKNCSHYKRNHKECTKEVGCKGSYHYKDCPEYKSKVSCPECGSIGSLHKSTCSKYISPKKCPECGSTTVHKKGCSKSKKKGCPECGSLTMHKSTCSKFKKKEPCKICGGLNGKHKKDCELRDKSRDCPYCGTVPGGRHKKDCPNRK